MAPRRLLLTFCFGAWIACADGTGPPKPGEPPGQTDHRVQLHELRWKPTEQPRVFDAKGDVELVYLLRIGGAADSHSYTASFWAIKGEERSVGIEYSDDNGIGQSLLKLTVPENSLRARPDGSTFAIGDSVLITVTFDTDQFLAHFQPAGLQFEQTNPALLEFSYTGADGDLDGDGDIDADDETIETDLLDVWYSGDDPNYWSSLSAYHSIEDKIYRLNLEHFSSYAVSW